MNPKVTLAKCEVLEYENRPYKGKDGSARTFRTLMFRYQDKVFKMGIGEQLAEKEAALLVKKTVDLSLEMSTFGTSIDPQFRIVGVAA